MSRNVYLDRELYYELKCVRVSHWGISGGKMDRRHVCFVQASGWYFNGVFGWYFSAIYSIRYIIILIDSIITIKI